MGLITMSGDGHVIVAALAHLALTITHGRAPHIHYVVCQMSNIRFRDMAVQMDATVNEAFKLIDDDATGRVDKPGFDKCMLEVLGGIMLQLEGKPIGVKSSAVVPPDRTGSIASGMPF